MRSSFAASLASHPSTPGRRVEPVEVEGGQLDEHGLQGDVLELDIRAGPYGGSRQLERQRVPACHPVDVSGIGADDPSLLEELFGLALIQVAKRHAGYELAPTRRRVPVRDRRLATGENQARVLAQGRRESWRSQLSSRRRTSYVSRTSTTRSPSCASRSAASSAVVSAPPTALPSASRKPRSVGSIDRQSIRTTVAPRARASPTNGSRSVDFPTRRGVHEDHERAALLQRPKEGGSFHSPADDLGRPLLDEFADRSAHSQGPSSLASLSQAVIGRASVWVLRGIRRWAAGDAASPAMSAEPSVARLAVRAGPRGTVMSDASDGRAKLGYELGKDEGAGVLGLRDAGDDQDQRAAWAREAQHLAGRDRAAISLENTDADRRKQVRERRRGRRRSALSEALRQMPLFLRSIRLTRRAAPASAASIGWSGADPGHSGQALRGDASSRSAVSDHPVDDPVVLCLVGAQEIVRSRSADTFSSGWSVWREMISSRRRLTVITSRAWISMSVACPSKPPET